MRAVKLCQRGVKDPLGRLVLPRTGAEIANEMSYRLSQRAAPAPYALPAGFALFLAVGTVAAALHGRLPAGGVLIACAVVAFWVSFAAEPIASVLLAGIGWLTVIGFSRPPYAQLRPAGPAAVHAAVVVAASALAGAIFGLVFRWYYRRLTLVSMGRTTGVRRGAADDAQPEASDAASGGVSGAAIGVRRRLAGVLLAAVLLPLLTLVLAAARAHLNLADFVLVYLVAVVAITVIGGFWPAVLAAVAASLLLNWYFTVPIHTFTIQQPRELLALLLFVTAAVAVSSVVHLAARRAVQAARAREEAAALLELAQTVLGGGDSPAAVLEHLTRTHGDQAELLATIEQNADRLDALIGNLLDMSRLHTGSLQPFLRPTAIDEVAPVAAVGLDDSLRLDMAVPDGFPLVLADPGLLEQVLANLFSNALRYSPAGRPPELHAYIDGNAVRLEVVDHGPGVPDEQKELIFE